MKNFVALALALIFVVAIAVPADASCLSENLDCQGEATSRYFNDEINTFRLFLALNMCDLAYYSCSALDH